MAHDRDVAGIRCLQVLERLSDFVDDELPGPERARIEAHLRGCDWCERFGSGFAETVRSVREGLGVAQPVAGNLTKRLLRQLDDET